MAEHNKQTLTDVRKWREVFLRTPDAREVLTEMLIDLHFFDSVTTPEEMALKNFAMWLLFRLGIFVDSNVYKIVDTLSTIEYNTMEE
jgi:hypothetical protein